jgi:DNA-binding MarR family transcriptional regulator
MDTPETMPDPACFDSLKLENQLCFPLYAAAKEIIRHYKPFLDDLDLTYTQYIIMMVLWERQTQTVKELGETLYLDSGTLTPVLKKLEQKGYVSRNRSTEDERSLIVSITPKGKALRCSAVRVPEQIAGCIHLTPEEAMQLYSLLYKVLGSMNA